MCCFVKNDVPQKKKKKKKKKNAATLVVVFHLTPLYCFHLIQSDCYSMEDDAETKLLKQWVSIYEEFELLYRTVFVKNVEKKKLKGHIDYAHNESSNNHVNAAVIHEPQAKWCIIFCLDAMISTVLTVNVNDQTTMAVRRTFNQHEVLRNCIFQPIPKREPSPVENDVDYATLILPGLYCPQPGYYLPCPTNIPPRLYLSASFFEANEDDDQESIGGSEENVPSVAVQPLVPLYHPVVPAGDGILSTIVHIFSPISQLYPSTSRAPYRRQCTRSF